MNKAIQSMFDKLPRVYELINHIVSLGMDTSWRKRAASYAFRKGGSLWLDVSTGTGEMAACLRRCAQPQTTVIATDFSMPMLLEARKKKASRGRAGGSAVLLVMADTGQLPFRSNCLDLVTISLAARNVATSREALLSCLREFLRVLKPGGWLVNLETSQPESPVARYLFHKYVAGILAPVGAAVSRSKAAYSYLSDTIRNFYDAHELAQIIREAGFENVNFRRLFLGVAAVHKAEKSSVSH